MIPSKGELLPAAVEFPVMSHIQFRLNKDNSLSGFPWWSIAGSLPSSIGDTGLLPGLGTKILYVSEQLWSPSTTMREACTPQQRAHILQLRPDAAKEKMKLKIFKI